MDRGQKLELVIGQLDVGRGVEANLVNVKEGDMGGEDCPGKLNRIAT